MSQSIFSAENLSAHYLTRFGEKIHAVKDVSFNLKKGEILGVAGESGCGKTTLVNACMGLYVMPLRHTSGDVRIEDKSIIGLDDETIRKEVLSKKISIIPQGALNSLNPTRKIKDFAADLMISHYGKQNKKEIVERLRERFELIGLDTQKVLNAYPVELPAGVKQRIVIGISTLFNPKVVVADEPTSALDVSTQKEVIKLLFDMMEKDIISSMIFITHELPLLRHVADNIAIMYAGEFVEYTNTKDIFDPRQPYTKALMGAMLNAEEGEKNKTPAALFGAPPDLKYPISGCAFAERCPQVRPECRSEKQELRKIENRIVRCNYAV